MPNPWNYDLFIDGQWVGEDDGKRIEVIDPSNEKPIGTASHSSAKTAIRAISAARRAFDEGPWPWMKPTERAAALIRMAEVLESRSVELRELIVADNADPPVMPTETQRSWSLVCQGRC